MALALLVLPLTCAAAGAADIEVRKGGSSWGSASNCSSYDDVRKVAALLIFFSDDF
jgi:hypothetical protein